MLVSKNVCDEVIADIQKLTSASLGTILVLPQSLDLGGTETQKTCFELQFDVLAWDCTFLQRSPLNWCCLVFQSAGTLSWKRSIGDCQGFWALKPQHVVIIGSSSCQQRNTGIRLHKRGGGDGEIKCWASQWFWRPGCYIPPLCLEGDNT